MPTPSIQTLRADAQQVLNLDSISAVRSVVAATLANANAGTPLNPNLTTQQLWNEFYQIVTQPKSDIESIIANQLMKFMYAPPAPGGAGADKQVIFNDGGVLAGDPQFLWNKTTNLLTVTGSATISGDLTVDTSTLKVDSANNRVGIRTASPTEPLTIDNTSGVTTGGIRVFGNDQANARIAVQNNGGQAYHLVAGEPGVSNNGFALYDNTAAATRLYVDNTGVVTWRNVGGVAGTAMTLNSTGLGIGTATINERLVVQTALTGTTAGSNVVGRFQSNASGYDAHIALGDNVNPAGRIGYLSGALYLWTNGASRLNIDTSGNVGVGVTPSAWGGFGNLQLVNGSVSVSGYDQSLGVNYFSHSSGAYKYTVNGKSVKQAMFDGKFVWSVSGTVDGVAGDVISYNPAMTLDASGRLILLASTTTPATLATNGQLTFTATSDTNLRFSYRGSDGTTRVANITLA